MNPALGVESLVVSGLLVTLALAGALMSVSSADRVRQQALLAVALGLAVTVAGRIHKSASSDVWVWLIVVIPVIRNFWHGVSAKRDIVLESAAEVDPTQGTFDAKRCGLRGPVAD